MKEAEGRRSNGDRHTEGHTETADPVREFCLYLAAHMDPEADLQDFWEEHAAGILQATGIRAESWNFEIGNSTSLALFKKTGNPLYVWLTRALARINGQPVPAWVEQELDASTAGLLNLLQNPPEKVPAAVGKALGFGRKGGGSEFTQVSQFGSGGEHHQLALAAWELILEGATPSSAWTTVGVKFDVSEKRAERAMKRFAPGSYMESGIAGVIERFGAGTEVRAAMQLLLDGNRDSDSS